MKDLIKKGDCLQIMPEIPAKSIDMILCDLPYGTTSCKWDEIIPLELLWKQYKRIIKDNGAIVLTASQPFTSILTMSNPKMFRHEWIYVKKRITGFALAKWQPLRNYETVLVFSKKKVNYYPQGLIRINKITKNTKNIGGDSLRANYEESEGKGSLRTRGKKYLQEFTNFPRQVLFDFKEEQNRIHPTQKPVALFEYLIKTYSKKGDLVLDNCAGSGTTGVACRNTKRNFILIEKEQKFIGIIKKRLKSTFHSPFFGKMKKILQ